MISILITYHDEKELVESCINSFRQNLGDGVAEIIVFDDCSKFRAVDYIKSKDVKIIRSNKNIGPGQARNILAKHAISEYIHFHDADDLVKNEWCEHVLNVINYSHPDIVFTEIQSELMDGTVISNQVMKISDLIQGKDPISFAIQGSILLPSSTMKKEFFNQIGGFKDWNSLKQSEDFDFHLRAVISKPKIVVINKSLVIQRLRADSHSSHSLDECYMSALKVLQEQSDDIKTRYSQEIAYRAYIIGVRFYSLNNFRQGDYAFSISEELKKNINLKRGRYYQLIYIIFGLSLTERLALFIRRNLPTWFKSIFK